MDMIDTNQDFKIDLPSSENNGRIFGSIRLHLTKCTMKNLILECLALRKIVGMVTIVQLSA